MKRVKASMSPVDEYIARFPANTAKQLEELRAAIRSAAPTATESISYGMPALFENGYLVYFAAFSKHIGFYPTSSGVQAFSQFLSAYKHSKGAIQFPIGERLPLGLVKKIVRFRLKENAQAAAKKPKKPRKPKRQSNG